MATTFDVVSIGAADRSSDVVRVELWRTINGVGNFLAILRNTAGKYDGVFDVQNQFYLNVNGPINTLFQGRVDGPAVTLTASDVESIWDEYIVIRGVDQTQDLLFHNDFDHNYPDISAATQTINQVMNNVINTDLSITNPTNITYTNKIPDTTPIVGSVEFKEGTNFLATLQELHRRAGYVFYVDDTLAFRSGAPGFSAAGVTLTSIAGSALNNIIGIVDYQERDGDKHYNYVKLYGKSPMFDGYTEGNVPAVAGLTGWRAIPVGHILNETTSVRVGGYSVVGYNNDPVNLGYPEIHYTLPYNNYTTFDFTNGEIGVWAKYDNTAGAPGDPAAGGATNPAYLYCILTDSVGTTAGYYGASSKLYLNEWGYCTFPIGEEGSQKVSTIDEWFFNVAAFDWANVVDIEFLILSGVGHTVDDPSHLYLDGLSIPEPCIAVATNLVAQASYRRRPFIDYYTHINTQNSLAEQATEVLEQVESTHINRINLVTPGTLALRYAGQSIDVNIPTLGLNTAVMYITQLHHIIEPHQDVSGGYGFDWITEVEAVPAGGVAYDMGRLRDGPLYSANQGASRTGTGLRIK